METNKKCFMFSGKGNGAEKLLSFDNALIDAQVANYNLVKISSIMPPYCTFSKIIDVGQGGILFSAYASITQKGEGIISASVAVGIPEDERNVGVIMEYSGLCDKKTSESRVIDMVAFAMATRKVRVKEIKSLALEKILSNEHYSSVVSGIALW